MVSTLPIIIVDPADQPGLLTIQVHPATGITVDGVDMNETNEAGEMGARATGLSTAQHTQNMRL